MLPSLPPLYPILDTAVLASREMNALDAATVLFDAGVRLLQYRHKAFFGQREFDEAARLAEMARAAGAVLILNDRADFAALLGCGLHIGQDDLSPVAARQVVDEAAIVGFSCHNRRQLLHGNAEPVDYLALGPIFPTASKAQPDPVVGLDRLRAWKALTRKPLAAIGGVSLEQAPAVAAAGADYFAVISALFPAGVTRETLRTEAARWLRVPGRAA